MILLVTISTNLIQAVVDVFIDLWNSDFFCGVVLILVSLGIIGFLVSVIHIRQKY